MLSDLFSFCLCLCVLVLSLLDFEFYILLVIRRFHLMFGTFIGYRFFLLRVARNLRWLYYYLDDTSGYFVCFVDVGYI